MISKPAVRRIIVERETAEAKSRLVLIALATMTLRLMERWRNSIEKTLGTVPDYEKTLIIGAIVSIRAEKLMRVEPAADLQTLARPFPSQLLTKCNTASIAAATGINRETVRRKINELIRANFLVRDCDTINLAPGVLQLPLVRENVQAQLQTISRSVNQLLDLGVMKAV